jgi:hypothetical protein
MIPKALALIWNVAEEYVLFTTCIFAYSALNECIKGRFVFGHLLAWFIFETTWQMTKLALGIDI